MRRFTAAVPAPFHTADPATVLVFHTTHGGTIRVQPLNSAVIRVQHAPPDALAQPRIGQYDALGPGSGFAYRADADGIYTLTTGTLALTIHTHDFRITWAEAATNVPFAADTARGAYAFNRAGQAVRHDMVQPADALYLGFGERSGPLDKRGRRLRMMNIDAIAYDAETTDPLYKHYPFYIVYRPDLRVAYGLFYDNFATTTFDLGQTRDGYHGPHVRYEADLGTLDYSFIYGPTIPDVIARFTALTGRPALPPRWALGYLASSMTTVEAEDADARLEEFIALLDAHDIPCDGFHLSSGYTKDAQGRRMVFTWNRQHHPDPAATLSRLHARGLKVIANVKPYLLESHPRYAETRDAGLFVRSADDESQPLRTALWSAGVHETAHGSYLDFSREETRVWWAEQVRAHLLDYGIDAVWNDNNEFQAWDDAAQCAAGPLGALRPLLTLWMVQASHAAQTAHRPGLRPYVLSRAGLPGIQAYAQTWSGDNHTSWHTLRWNLPMGLSMGLSGSPNTGHDVGGFAGPAPDPELFVRWVQAGVFHPRFTIHSYNADGTVNAPWMHPDVLPIVQDWIRFRYALIPYLYSLFAEAAETGQPIIRPLVYAFPDAPPAMLRESFVFMLGPGLLVAPVLEPGVRTWPVDLPPGTRWYDWYSGALHQGRVIADAPLSKVPLLAREGSLIPTGKVMPYVGAAPDDRRVIHAFPHQQTGTAAFTLYEDDGLTAVESVGQVRVTIRLYAAADALRFDVTHEGTGYALPYDSMVLRLPPDERRPVIGGDELARDESGWRRVRLGVYA